MELKEYHIKVNPIEAGALLALIITAEQGTKQLLQGVYEQLVAFKKEAEEEAGVKKEIIPGGLLRITDKDGNVIVRAPLPYELEGN